MSGGIRSCHLKDNFVNPVTVPSGRKIFTSESVECFTDLPLFPCRDLQTFLGKVIFPYFFQECFRFFSMSVLLTLCLNCFYTHLFDISCYKLSIAGNGCPGNFLFVVQY